MYVCVCVLLYLNPLCSILSGLLLIDAQTHGYERKENATKTDDGKSENGPVYLINLQFWRDMRQNTFINSKSVKDAYTICVITLALTHTHTLSRVEMQIHKKYIIRINAPINGL